jgi:hypothetical protein
MLTSSQHYCRTIIDKVEHPSIGTTEIILSNGMRVCYKYTDFLDDQVSSLLISVISKSASSRLTYLNSISGSSLSHLDKLCSAFAANKTFTVCHIVLGFASCLL